MYFCYVDESGDPGPQGSRFLILGAAALFEGKWGLVLRELEHLIAAYWPTPPRPTEIHMAELRKGKGAFRSLPPPTRVQLERDFCAVARGLLATELRMFCVVVDKPWWFARNPGKSGDDLYAAAFEELSSRFDLFLRRRHAEYAPSKGIVIADPHKEQLSRALKTRHRLAQLQGNKWAPIYNLVESVFFLDSHESPGLQLADLCSYAVWRLVTANDDSLALSIAESFDREPLNAAKNPGKWHGVKYLGADATTTSRLNHVWP